MTFEHFFRDAGLGMRRVFRKARNGYAALNRAERERNEKELERARGGYRIKPMEERPLVSILIPTYNRGRVLVERTIPSILRQTYQNFEVIIVGDSCVDDTAALISKMGDPRVKFFNLPERGKYPAKAFDRWMVAGTPPANKALELSSGDWIAPLDDDDEFVECHLETMLKSALSNKLEFVYGKVLWEAYPGKWRELGSWPIRQGRIAHQAVLYSSMLKFFRYDIDSWKFAEPVDWNMWRRMNESGVRMGFVNKVVGKHFLERTTVKKP